MFRSRSQARDNFTVFDKFCLVQKLLLTLLGRIVHDHARRACDSRQRTFWLRDGLGCDGSLEVFEGGSGTCQPNFEVGGLPVVSRDLGDELRVDMGARSLGPMPDVAFAEQWSHPAEPIQDLEQLDNKPRATPVSVPLAKRQKHRLFPHFVCLSSAFLQMFRSRPPQAKARGDAMALHVWLDDTRIGIAEGVFVMLKQQQQFCLCKWF